MDARLLRTDIIAVVTVGHIDTPEEEKGHIFVPFVSTDILQARHDKVTPKLDSIEVTGTIIAVCKNSSCLGNKPDYSKKSFLSVLAMKGIFDLNCFVRSPKCKDSDIMCEILQDPAFTSAFCNDALTSLNLGHLR